MKNCDVHRNCKPAAEIIGHITASNPALKIEQVNEIGAKARNSEAWLEHFLAPSSQVQQVIDKYSALKSRMS